MKDGTVRQAIGYWLQDSNLSYVTPQSAINHITLDQLDRQTTYQLNAERGLEFDIKPLR
jgi:hypothetical protein